MSTGTQQGYWGPPPPSPGWNQPRPGTNGFAIASLVLGILGGVLLSVIFGIVALRQIGRTGAGGKGLAVAGLVLSGLWLLAGAVIVVVAVVTGADRDESGAVVDGGRVDAASLEIGDCYSDPGGLDGPESTYVSGLSLVPCTEPHYAEAFAEFDVTGGPDFPGEDAVIAQAGDGCVQRFEEFVGLPYADSELDVIYLYPTARDWAMSKTITCSVIETSGADVKGSLAGAAR